MWSFGEIIWPIIWGNLWRGRSIQLASGVPLLKRRRRILPQIIVGITSPNDHIYTPAILGPALMVILFFAGFFHAEAIRKETKDVYTNRREIKDAIERERLRWFYYGKAIVLFPNMPIYRMVTKEARWGAVFPGIEMSSSTLQCKVPPFSVK